MDINQKNKEIIWNFWQRMNHVYPDQLPQLVKSVMHETVAWFGPQPINQLEGVEAVIAGYWQPLYAAFPDLKRDCHVFMGGSSGDEDWVSACGYLSGTFAKNWLGIPATGRKTHIHFGQFYRMQDEKIVENYLILDVLGVMRQAGFQVLPPSRGAEGGKVLRPATGDGVLLTGQDELETRQSRQLVSAMLQGMYRFDGKNLDTMEMEHYWHPDMHWYGPTGIGSCYSLAEFQEFHQGPWLQAFPDRMVEKPSNSGRSIGIQNGEILAEGRYASLGIWDTPFSVHRGELMGVPATGQLMTIRDFDWYRRNGDHLVQNWVPIDLVDLFRQMGVDLFERMSDQLEQRKAGR